jgi:glycosyltransferase involved in cell wall biosynthesis
LALPDHIELVTQTPGLALDAVTVVVTVPTFRRPVHLLKTLASLAAQRTDRRFAVVLVDNDSDGREGVAAAKPLFDNGQINGILIVETLRGNCNAYNAAWLTALKNFPRMSHLLVIDDDEIADPDWIETMSRTREQLGADLVGGPQVPVFPTAETGDIPRHPVFTPPYPATGLVPLLYSSGNLLVSRNVLEANSYPFLDPRFNFIGGGDANFIDRSVRRGFKAAWCHEAPVRETVPANRLERSWLRARGIRDGVISTLVEKGRRSAQPLGSARVFVKSIALLVLSPLKAVLEARRLGSLQNSLYYVHVGLGRTLAHFGYADEQYRHTDGR